MLTDCPSQFEMKGVNNIPKSFQKLIREIQNVKQNKKQSKSKSTSLDVKTVPTKNPTAIKKKRTPKQTKPTETAIEENYESNIPENSVQILNQTNITEFFNTAKRNLLNRRANKNLEKGRKQEVPKVDVDILSSDDDNFLCTNQNPRPTTDFKEQDFSLSGFQNPDYLSFLSDRNHSFNPTNEANGFGNTTESSLKDKQLHHDQPAKGNWKTFNEMNDDMDCDFIIERKKNIAPNVFYSNDKSNVKIPSTIDKNIDKSGSSVKENSDGDIIRQQNVSNDTAKELMKLLRDDRKKMTTLLNQVKSMNDSVTKARQDISKFFVNRNS